jgi:hypothetical protein
MATKGNTVNASIQQIVQQTAERVAAQLNHATADELRTLLTDDGLEVDGCAVWLRPDTGRIVAFRGSLDDDSEAWAEIDVELPAGLTRLPDSGREGWIMECMGNDNVPEGAPGEMLDLLTAERWLAQAADGSRWLVDMDEDEWLLLLRLACERADA